MNPDDFRSMRRGQVFDTLKSEEIAMLRGYESKNANKDRALLLLHGFSSTPLVFRELLPHLKQYDAVIAPTLPGHGDTLDVFSKTKASDWISFIENSCDTLCNTYKKVDVLGLSLGGVLANHLSQKFKLNHLYLLAPAFDLRVHTKSLGFARVMSRLGFTNIRSHAGDLFTDKHYEIAYRQLPIQSVIEILTFIKELQFSPPSCPTDVFLGCHDNVVDSDLVAKRFEQLDTTIHWLNNTAHVVPLDGDIEYLLKTLN